MPAEQYVMALVMVDAKALLLRRSHFSDQSGKWDLPGGKLMGRESPLQAMRRVTREILGVEPASITLRTSFFGDKKVFNQVYDVVLGNMGPPPGFGLKIGKPYTQVQFFSVDELLRTDDILHRDKIIEAVKARLQ